MLGSILSWFDANPFRQVILALITVGGGAILAGRSLSKADDARSDWRWIAVIFAILLAGRWPALFMTRQLNPDESFVITGALTLKHEPVFWRSVFGLTTGPLDFYVLLPALGFLPGYMAARFTGMVLLGGALLFAHQTLAMSFGRRVARTATFGAVCFEALTLHADFLHYSTELLPVFLLSAAFYFGRRLEAPANERTVRDALITGVLLGGVPFAKLQAAPIAAVGGLLLCIRSWLRLRSGSPQERNCLKALLAGSLMIPALLAAMLMVTPDRRSALVSYLAANVSYAQAGFGPIESVLSSIGARLLKSNSLYIEWLASVGLLTTAVSIWAWKRGAISKRFFASTLLFLLLSVACVAAPRRPFLHYLQLTIIPLTLVFGAALAGVTVNDKKRVSGPLLLGLALPLLTLIAAWRCEPSPYVGRLQLYQQHPTSDAAAVIRTYENAGEPLALWGWSASLYVETECRQATRHATTELEIMMNPYSSYFRDKYYSDFVASLPPVFVDMSFLPDIFPNREIAHDISFPELGEVVRKHYQLVRTINETRIYVRRDRLEISPTSQ